MDTLVFDSLYGVFAEAQSRNHYIHASVANANQNRKENWRLPFERLTDLARSMSSPILLVEGNFDDLAFEMRALREAGLEDKVTISRDGVDVLDYLFRKGSHANRPPGNPEVILLDVNLPHISGFAVLAKIRAHPAFNQIAVVLIGSVLWAEEQQSAYDLGANCVLEKPASFREYTVMISKAALFWLRGSCSPVAI